MGVYVWVCVCAPIWLGLCCCLLWHTFCQPLLTHPLCSEISHGRGPGQHCTAPQTPPLSLYAVVAAESLWVEREKQEPIGG